MLRHSFVPYKDNGCVMLTGALRSTQTAGEEILLGLVPLHVQFRAVAIVSAVKLRLNIV